MDTILTADQLWSMMRVAVVISVGIIGIVQWMKNRDFIYKEDGKCDRKKTAMISLICAVILGTLNSPIGIKYCNGWVEVVDIIVLVLAFTQICWEVLAQALPKQLGSVIDKIFGAAASNGSTSDGMQ